MGKPRTVDVLWLVEHVARELDVACAASLHLAREYGRSVVIEPIRDTSARVRATYAPRVVVLPYCYSAGDWALREYVGGWSEPPVFFNLSWEQLYSGAKIYFKKPHDSFAITKVVHHAWGDFFKHDLGRMGVPEGHIRVNGHPAYGLFDEPYRRRFNTRAELAAEVGLDPAKRWVFFPENHVWAFLDEAGIEARIAAGVARDDARTMQTFCVHSIVHSLRWVLEAARKGSVEVIIRPRPWLDPAAIEIMLRELAGSRGVPPRVHVTKLHSVREWLLASDVACSSFSTSIIEGAVAGTPSYFLEPVPFPEPLRVDWHPLVPRIRTQAEFLHTVRATPDASVSQPLEAWARSQMLAYGDPIAGLARIVDGLAPPARRSPAEPAVVVGPPEDIPHEGVDRFTHQDVDRIVRAFAGALEGTKEIRRLRAG